METPGASTRALLVPAGSGPRRKRAGGEARAATSKQRVLDEEEYIEGLQTVIQRDFFPDVEKLQAQKEYLEAEENGDLERMRQIAIKFGSALGKMSREPPPPYVTPATFETPDVHTGSGVVGSKPRGRGGGLEEGDGEAGEEAEKEPLPSLDVFLSRYTSEDNASFQEIMEVAKEKSRARHTWLYQAEEEFEKRQKDNLTLPSAEHQAIESSQAGVETWKYKAKNSLMYYPEGVPDEEQLFKKPRQVVHKNTRFLRDPFSQALSRSQLQQAAALNAQHKQGKVGPDGKELIPQDSPRVGGFGFVATPSPAPGVNESPLMTWGEVENTPLRVEGSETPYVDRTPGPAFKILEPGRRERLGLKMANEAAAKNRAKKQEALRRVTENLASFCFLILCPCPGPRGLFGCRGTRLRRHKVSCWGGARWLCPTHTRRGRRSWCVQAGKCPIGPVASGGSAQPAALRVGDLRTLGRHLPSEFRFPPFLHSPYRHWRVGFRFWGSLTN
ncbi:splicing factor ESS-2 homolog isoform X1 [Ursus arctos]|uniref:splicing factor ESS-2 homolog isoform X1 n=1 Tax=Ursus arctos TaxID=9644 RepID=UPI001CF8E2BD|nr:splicing factor ESS-2 homolog isoform X1 [Ursus arctos]